MFDLAEPQENSSQENAKDLFLVEPKQSNVHTYLDRFHNKFGEPCSAG